MFILGLDTTTRLPVKSIPFEQECRGPECEEVLAAGDLSYKGGKKREYFCSHLCHVANEQLIVIRFVRSITAMDRDEAIEFIARHKLLPIRCQ